MLTFKRSNLNELIILFLKLNDLIGFFNFYFCNVLEACTEDTKIFVKFFINALNLFCIQKISYIKEDE